MITVACVESGDYCGAGGLYVQRMRSMVVRHLPEPHRFVCFTDNPVRHPYIETVQLTPGRAGWWNKVELFRPGLFTGRVLYLDLDNFVVGPLAPVIAQPGLVHLSDWGWDRHCYSSSVMVWDAGEHSDVWGQWAPERTAGLHGDQDWLTQLGGWPALPAPLVRSYKYHAGAGLPPGCSVLCCHGPRKPHTLPVGHWALQHWR